jgi:phosphoglycolate phosphatase
VGHLRRLIAFDLDGTLVDSRRDLAESANALIVELGGTPQTEDAIGLMVGEGARLLVQRALAAAGLAEQPGALARFLEIYDGRLLEHTRPYDGIPDALRAARRYGLVAVLTNKPLRASEQILIGLELRALVDEVIGGDGPFPRKPDPASLRDLMGRHGVSPRDAVLVGDSRIDCETAAAAASRFCLARYGFGCQGFPAEHLTGAEGIVDHPGELPAVLDRLFGAV